MIVVVDTGGTKTLISSFNEKGEVIKSSKFPTPKVQADYITVLQEKLRTDYSSQPVEALVIALPGMVKNGVALWCNNLKWKNFEAQKAFDNTFGDAPVLIENDANLAGLAEAHALNPIPSSVLYVTISTGIGTGFITDGRIDPGLRLSEGGRALVEFEGEVREWESFASGRAIRETFRQYARDITDQSTWQNIADRISRGFLAMIPVIQPDVVVIGGSIGTFFPKYSHYLKSILKTKLPPHIPCPQFIQASHPEEAVVYGGYYYAIDILAHKSA